MENVFAAAAVVVVAAVVVEGRLAAARKPRPDGSREPPAEDKMAEP